MSATLEAPTVEVTEHVADEPAPDEARPPLSPRLAMARGVAVTLAVLALAMLLQLMVVSRIQHTTSQELLREEFRERLALGTAPVGPVDVFGETVASGSPVALLAVPSLGIDEVVAAGTDAEVLYGGPGHRIDTLLPGQIGTSVIYGRRSAYGGPFAEIHHLDVGDTIDATTGQGLFSFEVVSVRRDGDPPAPPLAAGRARITLVTADGLPFVPSGLITVDADLVGEPVVGERRVLGDGGLPDAERPLGTDRSDLWKLALWLQALLLASLAAIWGWHTWHRSKTWVVAAPVLIVVGLATAGEITHLLPNLL